MNIILYGAGKSLINNENFIDFEEVSYIVDSDKKKQGEELFGKQIIAPEKLRGLSYDYVLIFSCNYYEDIYNELVNSIGVSADKIMYWASYYKIGDLGNAFLKLKNACEEEKINVLDYNANLIRNGIYCCSDWCNLFLYTQKRDTYLNIYSGIYKRTYTNANDVEYSCIDVVFLGNVEQYESISEMLAFMSKKVKRIALIMPYCDTVDHRKLYDFDFEQYGEIQWINTSTARLLVITTKLVKKKSIYIVAHKEFQAPVNDLYQTIWVGPTVNNIKGYIEDKTQDNIAHLNPLINECTALYWLWKNSRDDYLGIVHYRRFFLNDDKDCGLDNILSGTQINKIFKDFDIIVYPVSFFSTSIRRHLQISIDDKAFEEGYMLISESIKKNQPDYVETFERVMNGQSMFPCNMFITRKELFNQYCQWLFSIILEPAERIDVSAYDPYSKRVIGFFAERLFTVWLVNQNLRIKEMPVLITDDTINKRERG